MKLFYNIQRDLFNEMKMDKTLRFDIKSTCSRNITFKMYNKITNQLQHQIYIYFNETS